MEDYGDRVYTRQLARVGEIGEALRGGSSPIYVYLSGKLGSGKTRLAAWLLAQHYMHVVESRTGATGRQPLFTSAAALTELRFRQTGEEDLERAGKLEQVFHGSFLVIDDLARIPGYKGEEAFLERVVEERYNAELSTVLTGNAKTGVFGERFADFLTYFTEIVLVGKSRSERAGRSK